MATTFTDTLFSTKYKDDYADSDGYYRILFNAGRALQARELTQMQTIINKQIERFGDNIFKEGAVVKPGGMAINTNYEFVKLDATSSSVSATVGEILTGGTSGVKAEILEIAAATTSDPTTYFVRYVNTASVTNSSVTPRFTAGESLGSGRVVQIVNTTDNPAVGRGTRATIGESIFYTKGFFVFTEQQTAVISKYSDIPDKEVGFKVVQQVFDVNDDVGLYDNQGAVPNQTAPGADRFKISLVLTTKDQITSTENFIAVATVRRGAIFKAVSAATNLQYNIPRDVVATRIRENSGDYLVKPFRLEFGLDSQDTHLLAKVSDGIAVVNGYRAARFAPTNLRVPKPVATVTREGEFTAIDYGSYVDVLSDSAIGGPDISTFAKQQLRAGKGLSGDHIGNARVRAVHENGADLRYHLFDVKMHTGKSFRDVKSIGTDSNNFFNPIQGGFNTTLEEPYDNLLVYPLPENRPKTVTGKQIEVQIMRSGTTSGAGTFNITIPSNFTLDNAGDWIFITTAAKGGRLSNSGLGGLTTGSSSTTVTGLPTNAPIKCYVYGSTTTPAVRAKRVTTGATITATVQTDSDGVQFIDLKRPDIINVTRVRQTDSDGADLKSRFFVDDGQRDGFYGLGRLVLAKGQSAPGGNVFARFDHYTHEEGEFFSVSSYTGNTNYRNIPNHRTARGEIINLRNYLDFRPTMDSNGNFTEANIAFLPQPTDLVTSDNEYYLAQSFRLVIDQEGILRNVQGEESFEPSPPEKISGTLPLYNFVLNGNTLNDSDLTVRKLDHRRYTMKDIDRLEKRLTSLEELTSLNMLELATDNFEVLDSAGLNRVKSGFFVDNFTTHRFSDLVPGYRASIDATQGYLRPLCATDNIRLVFDSATADGIVRKGDNLYLEHTEEVWIDNPFATKAVKINPFQTSVYTGNMHLSPASDEWRDKEVGTRTIFDQGTELSTDLAKHWDEWAWNWGGKDLEDLKVGDKTDTYDHSSGYVTRKTVNKVVSEKVVEEVIGEKVLQSAILPFIRSRLIDIQVKGLRPNANVFLFMNDKDMSNFVRETVGDPVAFAATTTDFGNTLKGNTAHKDGATALTTDISGAVNISFQVPHEGTNKFRCGTHEIKVLDVNIPREDKSGSIARAIYTATGHLDTVHQDIESTRVLEIEGSTSVVDNTPTYTRNSGGGGNHGDGIQIFGNNAARKTGPNTWSNSSLPDTVHDIDTTFVGPPQASLPSGGRSYPAGTTGFGTGYEGGSNDGDEGGYDCYVATALSQAGYWSYLKKIRLTLWCMETKPKDKLDTKIWRNGYTEFGKKIIAPRVHNKTIQWLSEGFYQSTVKKKNTTQALLGKAFFYVPSYAIGIFKALTGKLVDIDRT